VQTIIIAEAGVNHNGDIKKAQQLIEVAADSGADYVKFQTFKSEKLVTPLAAMAPYQVQGKLTAKSQYQMLKELELSREDHLKLIEHCKRMNIKFLSTAFEIESANLLAALGQKIFKIPSGEITNLPFLQHVSNLAEKVIISTGMATINEISSALSIFKKSRISTKNITILHCTSSYPVPMNEVNLLAMQSLKKIFKLDVGYSDHSLGIEIPIAAVSLGATIIEKHFTLDRNLTGPDHAASLEPLELKSMVKAIRNIEVALGDGVKAPMPSEIENREIVRKSIVALRAINKGDIFNSDNLTTKRPGSGVSPMAWDRVVGKVSERAYLADELIDEP
jgi:N,N'-diacetyllegionaminate synthase